MSEDILAALERDYLLPQPTIANPQLSTAQSEVPFKYQLHNVLSLGQPRCETTLAMVRNPVTGEYCATTEASLLSRNSDPMSLLRASGKPENYATGSGNQVPFRPGGLETSTSTQDAEQVLDELGLRNEQVAEEESSGFCTVPDGFDRGLFDVAQAQPLPSSAFADIDLAMDYYGVASPAEDKLGDDHDESFVANNAEEVQEKAETDEQQRAANEEIDKIAAVIESKQTKHKDSQRETRREWAHVVDIAAGFKNFHQLVPKLARDFPFELDVFQKRAVYHLERGDSVFIAAHTSAGKTVVAEYAVALSQMHMTKTIYTSPIKALSNQKFNDFKKTFGEDNVGILTGDVKIRPEAPCLIMTTEVLKNMLYRGADVLRDVEFVVFDECHYINDIERGVVWEEVIIMLPSHVSIILLSATVPNTKEFAEWVGRTKKRDIYVISTTKRPVPLEHYLYIGKNQTVKDEIVKVVDKDGTFLTNQWKDAYNAVNKPSHTSSASRGGGGGGAGAGSGGRGGRGARQGSSSQAVFKTSGRHTSERQNATLWVHLVGLLRKQSLLPAVIFTFSRKKCEEYAHTLRNQGFLSESARSDVHNIVDRSLKRLKPEDRNLPQVLAIRSLLRQGIGVHHSGLLPIIKEVVEILFARGLIFCLFATETFAMGVNMPAKCVVFSSIRKHDGRSFRELLSGEYTQMAGRAGRRGLDDTGVVVINSANEVPDTATLHTMLLGAATKLESQFRLTYTMILNLLRAKQLRVEEVIKRSFGENLSQGQAPEQERRLLDVKKRLDQYPALDCSICEDDIAGYYRVASSIHRLTSRLYMKAVHRPLLESVSSRAIQAFAPGRLAIISFFPHVRLGALVRKAGTDGSQFVCMVIDPLPDSEARQQQLVSAVPPYPITDLADTISKFDQPDMRYLYRAVPTASIVVLLNAAVKIKSANITSQQLGKKDPLSLSPEFAFALHKELETLCKQDGAEIEYPWQKIRILEFQELVHERSRLISGMQGFQCCACPDLSEHFMAIHKKAVLQTELDELAIQLSDQNLDLLPDYRLRLDVLKSLDYVDEMGNVQLKGRVACEMNAADELVLTELILDNTLAAFEPEEIVALISAFVCTDKNEPSDLMDRLPPKLKEGRERVLEAARRVGSIQSAHGLPISVEEYQREFRFGLMEVAYEWARGLSFMNITMLTDTQEGIIVRCILRISDVLKNISTAAILVGDTELKLKLQTAIELIRRDIVFAASLYF
ncbi:Antiviral helicase ski2 [Coemansia sp. RSA 1813]|nr:Antiviral helicase ski2 [Coemansia sp. RSA 1646]KAJ1773355.1 Antiviral helicase ski2 [Coemansia sp. RSA 1843]KAJ2212043.1 Antiviral helicase ski2 [Coemansia sp. RSA 487]KAJ2572227.1 Antiviral helicase ski2 [Coemansia sp. RSA 1813]